MLLSLLSLLGLTSLISAAENGMNEKPRSWTLMSFQLHYCLTPSGCMDKTDNPTRLDFTMRQRYSNGTAGDNRDLSRDYWSDVKCNATWAQFTTGPSTWMQCSQPSPSWHESDFNPQFKFVGEPIGKKFPFHGKKTIAVAAQYPSGTRPKSRSKLNHVYLSNSTFTIETGKSMEGHRDDKDPYLLCGGATGEEDLQWCGMDDFLDLKVATSEVTIEDYAALGLGVAQSNPSW